MNFVSNDSSVQAAELMQMGLHSGSIDTSPSHENTADYYEHNMPSEDSKLLNTKIIDSVSGLAQTVSLGGMTAENTKIIRMNSSL